MHQLKFQTEPLAKEERLPRSMSGGGWQEGEQGLPGLPRGGSPPYSTSDHGQGDVHRGGRGAYSEGQQGDIQRFLDDVEASGGGKPRSI